MNCNIAAGEAIGFHAPAKSISQSKAASAAKGKKPEKPQSAVRAEKMRPKADAVFRYLKKVNWLGVTGFALYAAFICTAVAGAANIELLVASFVISCFAVCRRKKRKLNFFAYAGLVLSGIVVIIIAAIGVFCGRGAKSAGRSSWHYRR